jgi:tRNA(Ile)-lysidine synthase
LLRALERALDDARAPRPGAHVLVAVSGGPDSTALLAGLARLAGPRGLRVTAAHVDHGLRGAEGAAEQAAVAALAARLGVGCVADRAHVAAGSNLEARARDARYRALRSLAERVGAGCIALAHTEDDQVETIVLRLLRGAWRGGLGGMSPRRGRLWRPLLGATRADVRRFLADEDLPFAVDRTNADLAHARNRLRRLVVPLLAREFNPQLGRTVSALAARLRDEEAFLDDAARTRAERHRILETLATSVATEPAALARRIVRAWLDDGSPRPVAAAEVERTLALAAGRTHGNVAVPGPARIVREGDVLVRRRGRDAAPSAFRYELTAAGTVDGPGGAWRLRMSAPVPRPAGVLAGLSPWRACFDADALALPLVIRQPERGDRVRVPGVGTRKLQDVLVDAKVPRERRSMVPVVLDATGTIVWVAGVVRSAIARITPATRRVIETRLE